MAVTSQPTTENPPSRAEGISAWLRGAVWGGLVLLYAASVPEMVGAWMEKGEYSHGFLVPPICAALVWRQRQRLRAVAGSPNALGLLLLALGLAVAVAGRTLTVKFAADWSAPLAIAGAVLALYGSRVWRLVRFPVLFLFMACPLPNRILADLTRPIQATSTVIASQVMSTLGYPVLRAGSLIDIPGLTVEVAEVCSGYRGFIALLAIALLYGHLTGAARWKRLVLAICVAPIAMLVNSGRISGLIAVGSKWGVPGLHAAHDPMEMLAIAAAFGLTMLLGRALGCGSLFGAAPALEAPAPSPGRGRGTAPAAACVLTALGLVGTYVVRPLPIPLPHKLPVDTFARQVGGWQAGPDFPADQELLKGLYTAHIVEREYHDGQRRAVRLLLLTATDPGHIHSPSGCFRSQDWTVHEERTVTAGGQPFTLMRVSRRDDTATVGYWFTGYYMPDYSPWQRRLYELRTRVMTQQEGMSMLVRVMATDTPEGRQALLDFARDMQPELAKLKATAGVSRW